MSRRAPLPPPEFFIDRSLGRRHLAEALTGYGLVVHTLSSVYGEERGQSVEDAEWLALAGERGWVVLMKDARSVDAQPRSRRFARPASELSA